jgi:hypothetical protein
VAVPARDRARRNPVGNFCLAFSSFRHIIPITIHVNILSAPVECRVSLLTTNAISGTLSRRRPCVAA